VIAQSNRRPLIRLGAAVLLALSSCSKHQAGTTEKQDYATAITDPDSAWLASRAAGSLARTFRAVGLDATEEGPIVVVASRKIGVAARVSNRGKRENDHLLAADFDISMDGTRIPTFGAGAVGVGETPDDARKTAAAEWAAQYGAPIGFAMATRLGAKGPPQGTDPLRPLYAKVEIAGQALFHGPPGLRGNGNLGSATSDEFVGRVGAVVVPILHQTAPITEYRSANVQVVVENSTVRSGECRVDGVVSPALLQAVSKLPWPEGSPGYMFKLFFVGAATGG
jgi:Family of unknown function (DUF6348)